jgi:hypothetical protein
LENETCGREDGGVGDPRRTGFLVEGERERLVGIRGLGRGCQAEA